MRKLEMLSGVEEVFEAYMWNFRLINMLWKINVLQKWTKNYKISLRFGFRFLKRKSTMKLKMLCYLLLSYSCSFLVETIIMNLVFIPSLCVYECFQENLNKAKHLEKLNCLGKQKRYGTHRWGNFFWFSYFKFNKSECKGI